MRVLVTGAGGFVGAGLVKRIRENPLALGEPVDALVATDRLMPDAEIGTNYKPVSGDLADPAMMAKLFGPGFDIVFHLASMPGSAQERDPENGRRINRDACLSLIDRVAAQPDRNGRRPRLVFASSIAVYGTPTSKTMDENSPIAPKLSYGVHKYIAELEIADRTRRGELLGASLRIPGIVARPLSESGHGSAFMSRIFHSALRKEPYACPVSADAQCWWMSRQVLVENLLHAATLSETRVHEQQTWQLPVLSQRLGDIVSALINWFPDRNSSLISFGNDAQLEKTFGRMPKLATPCSEEAGFKSDGSLDTLFDAVYSDIQAGIH